MSTSFRLILHLRTPELHIEILLPHPLTFVLRPYVNMKLRHCLYLLSVFVFIATFDELLKKRLPFLILSVVGSEKFAFG